MHLIKAQGAANLAITLVVLGAMTFTTLHGVNAVLVGQKIYGNEYRSKQAFEAAEAGLEYGLKYLQQNTVLVTVDANSDGKIDTNSMSGTLANGSSYTIVFSNPTDYDFSVIQASAVGTSDDSTSQREVRQLFARGSFLKYSPETPVVARDEGEVEDDGIVTNLHTDYTIWTGDNVDFSDDGHTVTNNGPGSSASFIGPDIKQNDSALGNATDDDFFFNFFGATKDEIKNSADLYFERSSSTNYNSLLNGVEGKLIWIEHTNTGDDDDDDDGGSGGKATIDSGTVVGSPTNPVILIVNSAELEVGGNDSGNSTTIYGLVVVLNGPEGDLEGHGIIHGMAISDSDFEVDDDGHMIYDPAVINNLPSSTGVYNKVAGSWNDMKL